MATRQPLPFCMIGRARSPSDLYAAVSAIISLSASASASANAAWRFSNVRRSCSSKRRKSSAVSSISAETSLRKARTPHAEAAQQIRNCHPVIVAPLIVRRWMYRLCSDARAAMYDRVAISDLLCGHLISTVTEAAESWGRAHRHLRVRPIFDKVLHEVLGHGSGCAVADRPFIDFGNWDNLRGRARCEALIRDVEVVAD